MSPNGRGQRLTALRAQWQSAAAALLMLAMWGCSDTSAPRISDRATKPLAVASPGGGPESFTGRYVVRHGDDFEHDKGTFEAMLEVDEEGHPATWGDHVTDEEYAAAPPVED